jgi:hypothetical protein
MFLVKKVASKVDKAFRGMAENLVGWSGEKCERIDLLTQGLKHRGTAQVKR